MTTTTHPLADVPDLVECRIDNRARRLANPYENGFRGLQAYARHFADGVAKWRASKVRQDQRVDMASDQVLDALNAIRRERFLKGTKADPGQVALEAAVEGLLSAMEQAQTEAEKKAEREADEAQGHGQDEPREAA